jgi:hypothetical protein
MEIKKYSNTKEAAVHLKCSEQNLRKNYCLNGHCYGIVPIKVGNRLLWGDEYIAKVLNGEKL